MKNRPTKPAGGRRVLSPDERRLLRIHYQADGAAWCAERLELPAQKVRQAAHRLGIAKRIAPLDRGHLAAFIRRRHPLGWSDQEIAQAYQAHRPYTERHTIGEIRRGLGLPSNALSEHRRRRVKEMVRRQLRREGVASLAELRAKRFREHARERGWPDDFPPRAVQITDALYERGPMTRRQIAAAIGMPWKGSRKSLSWVTGNDKDGKRRRDTHGSYLAWLQHRGFVVAVKRAARSPGTNHRCNVYAIPLWIKRGDPSSWPTTTETDLSPRGARTPRSSRKSRPSRRSSGRRCSTASASRTSRR